MTSLVPERAHSLETLLGDPLDPANALGFPTVLLADERAELLTAGEDTLAAYGLNAESVPAEHGGRLTRVDHLVEVMRTVCRRDPALGIGLGAGPFVAAAHVWCAGDPRQARAVAELLLGGGRVAVGSSELVHGHHEDGSGFTAITGGPGRLLSGHGAMVADGRRADVLLVLAKTDPHPGLGSHSLILVDRRTAPGEGIRDLPRSIGAGLRGVPYGGLAFDHVPVPDSALLGPAGDGLATAAKAAQLTRVVLPAMASGALDSALRIAVGHLATRRLYGGSALDLPHVRSVLTGVFADLLRAETLAAAGARALHLVPRSAGAFAACVSYGVSRLLTDAMDRLAELLGAHFYVREGPQGLLQKLLRDLAPAGSGHLARAAARADLVSWLPLLARQTPSAGEPAPAGLFALHADLPALRFDRLTPSAGEPDPLGAALAGVLDTAWDPAHRDIHAEVAADLREFTELTRTFAALPAPRPDAGPPPGAPVLADRYVRLLARISHVQIWRHATDPFLADPSWVRAALHRSDRRTPLPESVEGPLFQELLDRHHGHRTFGPAARPLPCGD
ncbi:acyl-CoA dehydrogenase [Streptomyces sp. NPDC006012]|uniref:acyl-CoA dehydrogenase n=1 Tax=Streptomyces sp. NPDC006012 TaxID=3364739 RepID=UPI0036B7FAA9